MNDNINDKVQEFIVACAFCGGEVELLLAIEEYEHARLNTICPGCKRRELKEVDLAHAKEVLTCHLCDSCGEVLPVEEFDDWFSCPDCSHDNEPPSWKEEEN